MILHQLSLRIIQIAPDLKIHVALVMWVNLHVGVYSKMPFKCLTPFKFVIFSDTMLPWSD